MDRGAAAVGRDRSDEEAAVGRDAFLAKACASCHTIRGTPAAGTAGADLTHVGSRKTIAAGLFETTRGSLAAWTADAQTLKPGNNMPMVPLAADELRSISAYIASWPCDAPPGPATESDRSNYRSVYLASREFAKRANSEAGPGYISEHPACRSEFSVNPPQSTPMVAILAFPAASAS